MSNPSAIATLAEDLCAGSRQALARAISLAENGGPTSGRLLAALPLGGGASLIGLTGAPGVGKSTLLAGLCTEFRKRNRRLAVLAVDPTSPKSGGAVLGDRLRMLSVAASSDLFVRSIATRGALGGLSASIDRIIRVLEAGGWDLIIIETVGVGQSEVDIHDIADCVAVICGPGFGDGVQAIKAGLLEIADLFVVNKADQPEASRIAQELRSIVSGTSSQVLMTSALRGDGLQELVDCCLNWCENKSTKQARRERLARSLRREAKAKLIAAIPELGSDVVEQAVLAIQAGRPREESIAQIVSAATQAVVI